MPYILEMKKKNYACFPMTYLKASLCAKSGLNMQPKWSRQSGTRDRREAHIREHSAVETQE